jgi:hypothetical protein
MTVILAKQSPIGAAIRCETDLLAPESPVRMRAPACIEHAIFRSEKPASEGILIGLDCSQLATT